MKKDKYEVRRKNILSTTLVSLTGQTWLDSNGDLIPWTGNTNTGGEYIGPQNNDIIFNLTGGTVTSGYYKWIQSGLTWSQITGATESIIKGKVYGTYNLPLFLESSVDEYGVMVGFDGYIEQVDQIVNFSYTQTGSTIQIYSTVNPSRLRTIVDQIYTVNWGDGSSTTTLPVNSGIEGDSLPTLTHVYTGTTGYTITISLNSPWSTQTVSKKVTIPQDLTKPNPLGGFTGVTIPSYGNLTGQTQDYLSGQTLDYSNNTGYTSGYTGFTYLALGGSKILEKKLYGVNTYTGVTGGADTIDGVLQPYSAYTFSYSGVSSLQTFYYKDYINLGYTLITGTTTGFTKEEVFNNSITRNEHFLGFVDEPSIFSDLFVERGKQGVLEKTFRLSEIDNTGELDVYGNGYYNIRKQ